MTYADRLELLAMDQALQRFPRLLDHDCVQLRVNRTPFKNGGRYVATVYCCDGVEVFECGGLAECARGVH